MHDNLAASYEARLSLLDHVANSLEREGKECLRNSNIEQVSVHVASASVFVSKAQDGVSSGRLTNPLVEVEDQLVAEIHVANEATQQKVESDLRACFTAVDAFWHKAADPEVDAARLRRLICVIPPQSKPPGWDGRDDVPKTFEVRIRISSLDAEHAAGPELLQTTRLPSGSSAVPDLSPLEETLPSSNGNSAHSNGSRPAFDVFLAHNSKDKPFVAELAAALSRRGLKPWLDSEQIAPGQSFQDAIQKVLGDVRTVAICIGPSGLGRWQALETKTAVSKCINEGIPVIPVLLPGVTAIPESLPFLAEFNWIQFVSTATEADRLDRLIWGISGQRPGTSGVTAVPTNTTPQNSASSAVTADDAVEAGKPGTSGRVLFGLHGIRTHAGWNRALYEVATNDAWQVRTDRWNFGFFSILQFISPWSRSAKVTWFRQAYWDETHDKSVLLDKGQDPSIVAHSFGTYILGNALLKYDWLKFNKIILCGSILPVDFPWDEIINRGQVQAVRNEYGVQDTWSGLVRWFVAGTGPSGRSGFTRTHDRLTQERFEYTHSEYFDKGHMDSKWLPFINKSTPRLLPVTTEVRRPRASRPWGLYVVYALLSGLVALFACWWLSQRAPASEFSESNNTDAQARTDSAASSPALSSAPPTDFVVTIARTADDPNLPTELFGRSDDDIGMPREWMRRMDAGAGVEFPGEASSTIWLLTAPFERVLPPFDCFAYAGTTDKAVVSAWLVTEAGQRTDLKRKTAAETPGVFVFDVPVSKPNDRLLVFLGIREASYQAIRSEPKFRIRSRLQ